MKNNIKNIFIGSWILVSVFTLLAFKDDVNIETVMFFIFFLLLIYFNIWLYEKITKKIEGRIQREAEMTNKKNENNDQFDSDIIWAIIVIIIRVAVILGIIGLLYFGIKQLF